MALTAGDIRNDKSDAMVLNRVERSSSTVDGKDLHSRARWRRAVLPLPKSASSTMSAATEAVTAAPPPAPAPAPAVIFPTTGDDGSRA